MAVSIKIFATPTAFERMRARGPQIVQALTQKMNRLMVELQSRVVGESIPEFFPKGAPNIASTVALEPAHAEGGKIVAGVTAGGPRTTKITLKSGRAVDYAAVQEFGVDHEYIIEPATAITGKQALAFLLDGKQMILRRVTHPGLAPRPFMSSELHRMEPDIVAELQSTFLQALGQ